MQSGETAASCLRGTDDSLTASWIFRIPHRAPFGDAEAHRASSDGAKRMIDIDVDGQSVCHYERTANQSHARGNVSAASMHVKFSYPVGLPCGFSLLLTAIRLHTSEGCDGDEPERLFLPERGDCCSCKPPTPD
ncbi:hypothetical protein FRZ40_15895 [Paraburkholderia azotifigens]|uniref:Uncharacterized protein n=1 Tax=Paraburkholderia azotifigens TaxID=2057004 RepID=A0A5C6VTV1_9BURK|nr:hypothetical protein FRZ40_15895 [Paraburkholderia azotifigens]